MNLRIITKNHEADSKIGFSQKSILEPIGFRSPTRQPGSYDKNLLFRFFGIVLFLFLIYTKFFNLRASGDYLTAERRSVHERHFCVTSDVLVQKHHGLCVVKDTQMPSPSCKPKDPLIALLNF